MVTPRILHNVVADLCRQRHKQLRGDKITEKPMGVGHASQSESHLV